MKRLKLARRLRRLKETGGNVSVFLTVAFASVLLVCSVLYAAANAAADKSIADAAFEGAGRSVLSEYDTRLLSEYGLLAFKGDETQIEEDVCYYAGVTVGSRISDFEITANLKEFSLLDADVFEKQLEKAAASDLVTQLATGSGKEGSENQWKMPMRTLRNDDIKKSLPSAGLPAFSFPSLTELNVPDAAELADRTSATVLTDEYIVSIFEYFEDGEENPDHFFNNEVEYILCGHDSDALNIAQMWIEVTAFRTIMNEAAIVADDEKMETVRSVAEVLSAATEIPQEAAQAAVINLWSEVETANDIRLLKDGRKVAVVKNHNQWATDAPIDLLHELNPTAIVLPQDESGATYKDYLRMFLFVEDRETKLARVQDLIQINLKGTYDEAFLLRSYYTGFRFTAKDGKNEFSYIENY
ncbi:MAG: DUF5702 domain-containing protein [Clostridiales Family XIII bacterium]|nr:DUF5702 domain-containing protein [Clostridiales Family XIII bacterium]